MGSMGNGNTACELLYEGVAAEVTKLIEHGTFRPGDRLPSVRRLSGQLRVSISTVLEAYRVLEDRGFVETRPQSGHYVRARRRQILPEPEISRPPMSPTQVSMGELVMMVLRDSENPNLVPLGCTIPSPDLLPAARLNRTLASVARRKTAQSVAYAMPPGCEALRVQIARRSLAAGVGASHDEVVVTNGCQEAIVLALRAVCRPGDTVAVESPTYYNFLQACEALGLRAIEIPTHPRTGLSLEALAYALESTAIRACLGILNFNNPLGGCMPDERKRELVRLLAKHEVPLIEDDIHGELSFSEERPKAAKAYDEKGLVMLCSSFSKTLAPGYRVGWILAGRFQRQVEYLKAVSSLASATLPQLAVAEFLAEGGFDRHLRRLRRACQTRVDELAEAVAASFPEGTRLTRPAGGFALWVELPEGTDALALYGKALEQGITIAPGPMFSPKQRYRNCIRLNAGYWRPDLAGAIERLGRLAGDHGHPVRT